MNQTTPTPARQLTTRLWAFLVRDFYNEVSYRFAFAASIVQIILRVLIFYFLAQLLGDSVAPLLAEYNGDYFSFVIIGLALGSYFGIGLTGFARALREAQTTGTLEALIMTPTPVSVIIVGSALWSYAFTTFRVIIYLLAGLILSGGQLGADNANYTAALLILILAIIAFASIGIIAASVIMVIKRGDPVTGLLGNLANLIGGVFYPIEVLPGWLQLLAQCLPITYALRGLRLALLSGASWAEVATDIWILLGFCLVLFPLSLLLFRGAVDWARRDGSLAHY